MTGDGVRLMKILGYVLFGMGIFLFVISAIVYESSPSNVVNYHGINGPNGLLIVGLLFFCVGGVMASYASAAEQRAYRKAHPEPPPKALWRIPDVATFRAIRANGYYCEPRSLSPRELDSMAGLDYRYLEEHRSCWMDVPIPPNGHFTLPDGCVIASQGDTLYLVES